MRNHDVLAKMLKHMEAEIYADDTAEALFMPSTSETISGSWAYLLLAETKVLSHISQE